MTLTSKAQYFVLAILSVQWIATNTEAQEARNDSVIARLELLDESSDLVLPRRDLAPKCDNFLRTVLQGRWVPKRVPYNVGWEKRQEMQRLLQKQKEELDADMRFVWKKKGIPPDPFGSTKLCGFYRLRRATSKRPSIGTWCDPDGPRPCCTNIMYGRCVTASEQNGCRCSKCVNVQHMRHAELMDWVPSSKTCKWNQYTPPEACEVLERSPVEELYLVGDSFIQNMYITMLMIMSGKPITGGWRKEPLTQEQQELCSNYGTTYWIPCRAMITTLDDMRHRDHLCGDGRNVSFKLEYKKYYSARFGNEFKELVRGLLGRKGVYIVVGIGFHVRMRLEQAIDHFMQPAVNLVKQHYKKRGVPVDKRWPKFLFSQPLDRGLLKPVRHLKSHSLPKQHAFEDGMSGYCRRNSIPVLDFTPLVKDVLTFDGVHYGVGVNMAKSQILLNYFASLPNE